MIQQENPALVIGASQNENDVSQESGAVTCYFTKSWPAISCVDRSEVPPSFDAGLKDIKEGRVIDLDAALAEPPSARVQDNLSTDATIKKIGFWL